MDFLEPSWPSTFELAGQFFACRSDPLRASILAKLLGAVSLDGRGERRYDSLQLTRFVLEAVDDADGDRLLEVLTGRDPIVAAPRLADVVMWIVECATGRTFGAAHSLVVYAASDWGLLRGRILAVGGRPDDDPTLRDLADIAYATLADRIGRDTVDRRLTEMWIDRETWGIDTGTQLAEPAKMAEIPPAPARPHGQRRSRAAPQVRRPHPSG